MRGVFFGTSDFAVPSLRAFAGAVDCALVVTQPDRPAGRGKRMQPTPVKIAADALAIATIEPHRLSEALETLRAVRADLFGVASYGKIIPQRVLDLAPGGALNVHPSLLPLYRGATPLQSQLRDGVKRSGVSIILMDAGMDTGDIVLQESVHVDVHETYGELHDRLARLGATLLSRACEQLADGTLQRRSQATFDAAPRALATATRPLDKADWMIGSYAEHATATDFANFVRSLAPAPAARVTLASFGNLKILAAHRLEIPGPALDPPPAVGTAVIAAGHVLVRASDGWLYVDELVLPGGKPMSATAFRNGYRTTEPDAYGASLRAWADRFASGVHA